jgi:two-component system sensor histidine kinase DesK
VNPFAGGIRATWWYTVAGLVLFQLIALGNWMLWLAQVPPATVPAAAAVLAALGLLLQVAAAVVLVRDYPAGAADADDDLRGARRRRGTAALAVGGAGAVLLGPATGTWMLPAGGVAFLLSLRPWPAGIRSRLAVVLTVLLAALWVADAPRLATAVAEDHLTRIAPMLLVLLPGLSAFSLWWWDLLRELDHAREVAGAVSAMRERLRLAGEVHDLQGHHLQVIALRLELAERLLDREPAAAAEQIRAARGSVDEARTGTRDLATRFRGVPLPDELANAADLLRAAGYDVQVGLGPGAEGAPAEVLGPLVRESVTNVLKHGAGGRARIDLRREDGRWRYAIANDRHPGAHPADALPVGAVPGSGIAAMRDRIAALGGSVEVRAGDDFELTVTLPAAVVPAAAVPTEAVPAAGQVHGTGQAHGTGRVRT